MKPEQGQLKGEDQWFDENMQTSLMNQPTSSQVHEISSQEANQGESLQIWENRFFKIFPYLLIIVLLAIVFKYLKYEKFFWQAKRTISEKDIQIQMLKQKVAQKTSNNQIMVNNLEKLKRMIENSTGQQTQKYLNSIKTIALNIEDIQYCCEYQPLPINPLIQYDGKQVTQFLYNDTALITKREEFIQERINFINANITLKNIELAKYNIPKDEEMLKEGIALNEENWLRLQEKFKFSQTKEELEFCILVPSYNNNASFRIEGNLNSIFTQNYTNYKVVIVNDASTDNSSEIYRNYFKFHRIDKAKYVYVDNPRRRSSLQNIYLASMGQCSKQSIGMILDGDDEFIGRNVLQNFNWAFQTKKAGVVYSGFYLYHQPTLLQQGITSEYTPEEKSNNSYRDTVMRFNQLRAFRTELLYQIKVADLQDENELFYTITYDIALFMPLMELSCGRVEKIQGQIHYLYNMETGLNDYFLDINRQVAVNQRIRKQKKYTCFKQFDERMKE